MSDKPSFLRTRPSLGPDATDEITRSHRCRLESLLAVDRGIGSIHRALRAEGELRDTVIVFTSDNGWFAGQHRIPNEKTVPYEENVRVPLVVRLPPTLSRAAPPPEVGAPVANVDLAPTLLQMAGARPCRTERRCRVLDGRSLLPLLRGRGEDWPEDRGILLELEAPEPRAAPHVSCDYDGIRTPRYVYVEHHSSTTGQDSRCRPTEEAELYDLRSDPFQLSNLASSPQGTAHATAEASLAARLARLRSCSGAPGGGPRPSGGHRCE